MFVVPILALALSGRAGPAAAQDGPESGTPEPPPVRIDVRWVPFIGCWEVLEGRPSDLVCVEPNPDDPASVLIIGASESAPPEPLYLDGASRPVEQGRCGGDQRMYLSSDEQRLFIHGEYTCSDGVPHRGRGLIAMVAPDEWVDIRSMTDGVDEIVLVHRYRKATPEQVEASGRREFLSDAAFPARVRAAAPPRTETLIEAFQEFGARLTNTWIVHAPYMEDLRADDLRAMSTAGVDESVLDAAIASARPDEFLMDMVDPGTPIRVAVSEVAIPEEELMMRRATREWFQPFQGRVTWSLFGAVWSPRGYLYNPSAFTFGNFPIAGVQCTSFFGTFFAFPGLSMPGCPFGRVYTAFGGAGMGTFGVPGGAVAGSPRTGWGGGVIVTYDPDRIASSNRGVAVAGEGYTQRRAPRRRNAFDGVRGASGTDYPLPPRSGEATGGSSGGTTTGRWSAGRSGTGRTAVPRGGGQLP
jgi:hypothetical protein